MYASSIDLQTKSLLIRIYYPTLSNWRKSPWLPLTHFYALGIHDFSQHPSYVYPLFYLILLFAKSDASLHAPLLQSNDRLPVVVFSAGLGGFRGSYSHITSMFARNKCVVFSIEHRDGSACASYHPSDSLKYAYPVTPDGMIEEEFMLAFRLKQRDVKNREVKEVVEYIRRLDESGVDGIEGVEGMSKKERVMLDGFKGRLDLDSMIISGHSFGASTALSAIQESSHPFLTAITFDPWMLSVNQSTPTLIPILNLQSSTFHWRENLTQLLTHHAKLDTRSVLGVVRDTRHEDFTDYGLVFPWVMKMIGARGKRHPVESKFIWESVCMRYLATVCANPVFDAYRGQRLEWDEVIVGAEAIKFLIDNQKEEYNNAS